jgi:hypothetical protein
MATFLYRRRAGRGAPAQTAAPALAAVPVPAGPPASEYLLPDTRRALAAQTAAALGILIGAWVAISPLFITLQHAGLNAAGADVVAGLVVVALGVFSLASRRGLPGLQFASLVLGLWVLVSSFILDAKFAIAAPMYWSNSWSGALLIVVALAALASLRRATR